MKRTTNILLVIAVVLPVVLLFWPFAEWNSMIGLLLRVIPAVALQVLLCRSCMANIVVVIPALFTGAFAIWGTYLYFTSPHWSNATVVGLVADYVSPFICSIAVLVVFMLLKKNCFSKGG